MKVLEAAKESKAYEPRDRVAYWMNLAMLQHHAKNYAASNALLEQASKRADELYTLSLSKTATTLFVNETMSDYQGENFEPTSCPARSCTGAAPIRRLVNPQAASSAEASKSTV